MPELAQLPPTAAPPPPPRTTGSWGLAALLFLTSLGTCVTLGGSFYLAARTDLVTDVTPLLLPSTIARVWGDASLVAWGFAFALPVLFILLAHELGHYLLCRRYGLPATPPYFLPAPVGLGTFGAFIRIRAPIRDKRELFDVGVGGPLLGFAALFPFLAFGVAQSQPVAIRLVEDSPTAMLLYLPGKSLLVELLSRLFHGALPPGTVLNPHPFALAGWVGLFATMLNLLPLGQLDGGHLLYAAFGRLQRRLAAPLWLALAALAWLWWGWLLWCAIVLAMGLRHPPVGREDEPLDPRRRAVAWGVLLLFVLCFMPVPIDAVPVAVP